MAFVGPLDAFNSQPIQTKVGTSQTNIFTATSTKVTKDSSGKVNGGTTTVYYSATAGNYAPAATTTDGGKSWAYLKDSNGKEILGADAKTSLEQGALKTNTQQQILAATKQRPFGGGLSPQEQKTVAPSTQNAAGASPAADAAAAPVNLTDAQNNLDNLKISGSDTTRKVSEYPDSKNLIYPITLQLEKQDCIKFTMLEYAPSSLNVQNISKGDPLSERSTTENRTRGKTVTLPIQPSISDTNTVRWGADEMNAVELIAASAALGTITEGAAGAGEAAQATVSLLQGASKDIKSGVAAGMAGKAAGTKGLLTRVTGGIVNPNMELLFEGPQLRGFTFAFTMSARDSEESKVIRNIIRFFKQGMSVKRASTGLFLKSPNTFEIKYMSNNKEHPWINKIKECALTSCTVNYTPAGNYATYADGAMTQYEMSLTFSELEPIYDDDYGKGSTSFDTEIGY